MRLSSAAVIGAWILCSCSARTPPPPTPTADAGTSSPAAPAAGPRAASPQALQAFMTYQHALLEIERRLPRSSGLQPSPGERTLMLELARDEEEARKRSGLSEDEIERWEAL
ncbi:MAG TPA: hypothetical protein VEY30_12195, partial [Myxococcaceae bacterium]|nr:hypothetical protein [Myxococcaceae bacterium]